MNEPKTIAWNRLSVEAAAIVGSILLAFAIDAWWDDHTQSKLERRLLNALLVEFEQNAELLRQAREEYEQYYLDALRILEYLENGPAGFDQTGIEKSFRGLLMTGSIHLESGTYDGLLGSGEISLIRNEELRPRLAAWPSYVREWTEEEEAVFRFVRSELKPYLSDYIRLRNVTSDWAPFPDGEPPPTISSGANDVAAMIEVSSSVKFDNLVYLKAEGLWYALRDGETLLAKATEIAELIEQDLAN